MSKRCARCEKVVYPIEELKCLDKTWHKGCFKCKECGMTLSMKTYKGFNKFPYCEAHIPKAKATTVAETPEMKRLAENTKNQSNVQYHAEFEKNKARFTQVADDPETKRLKQNTKNISNVTYHGDLEKKAKMEQQRDPKEDEEFPEKKKMQVAVEPTHVQAPQQIPPQVSHKQHPSNQYTSMSNASKQQQQQQYIRMRHAPQSNQYYQGHPGAYQANYHTQPQYPQQAMPSHQQHVQHQHSMQHTQHHQPPPQQYHHPHSNPISQAHTYQDSNCNAPTPYGNRTSQTLIYTSQTGSVNEAGDNVVGSISDYDPLNNQYGSISVTGRPQTAPTYRPDSNKSQRGQYHREGMQMSAHNQQKINAPPTNLGRCYRAIYDYEAADADEVSFKDGDLIVNCTSIDEGWMTGTVQRSGRLGMLPANYVQRVS